jgi:hydrogenase small subunit
VFEGSVMTGFDGNALRIAGKTGLEQIKEVAPKAAAIIAVGSCAVDGGWVKSYPNPAGATGISMYLASQGITTPVINLPTCPVNPVWLVAMVVDVLLLGELADGSILGKLDEFGRPKLIYGQTIHDNCPRRGHFENGEFVYQFGSKEEAMGYCLYAMGCKGPQTYTNCPIVRWNNKVSWCVQAGSPCIGCGDFNWVDENAPFLSRTRRIGIGTVGNQSGGWNSSTPAAVAGAVVAGALVVHGIGMKAAGRIGEGPPVEEMKNHDRKRLKKGGDN